MRFKVGKTTLLAGVALLISGSAWVAWADEGA